MADGNSHDPTIGAANYTGFRTGLEPGDERSEFEMNEERTDLSQEVKRTLGDYLSAVTHGDLGSVDHKNRFAIDRGSVKFGYTDENGYPQQNNISNSERFTDPENADGVVYSRESATRPQDLQPGSNRDVDAGRAQNGHTLLSSDLVNDSRVIQEDDNLLNAEETRSQNNVAVRYRRSVLENNRFTAASRMINDDPISPNKNYNPRVLRPGTLRMGASQVEGEDPQTISMDQLAQIGTGLSVRGSKELNSAKNGYNPTGVGIEAGAILPSFNQMGAERINVNILTAGDVLNDLANDEIPEGTKVNIGDLSWGAMNNVHDQYDGLTAFGMIALAIALTAATIVLYAGLGILFGLVEPEPPAPAKSDEGRYFLGRYWRVKQPGSGLLDQVTSFATLLGMNPTLNPYAESLEKGMLVFFGMDSDDGGILGGLFGGLEQSMETPGYNAIISRAILRSGVILIDQLKGIGSSPNLLAGAKAVISLIETFKRSKIMAAANTFATIGDHALSVGTAYYIKGANGEPDRYSTIDKLSDDAFGSAVQKNRLRNSLKLAWASNRSPSAYLIPAPILGMTIVANELGSHSTIAGNLEAQTRTQIMVQEQSKQSTGGSEVSRISAEDVRTIENALDAEYMPFYFHDLRTNEIVGFQAFLTSLTEDFSPEWVTGEGFGRVDKVKIYKATERKVNLSFMVVSTSPKDHQEMWLKIDKLTTLVYPQYTKGRRMITDEGATNFIQPFSQMISASPLIRLRIGDLIRSNYSKFALARLFGAANYEGIAIGGNEIKFSTEDVQYYIDDVKNILTNPADDLSFSFVLKGDGHNTPQNTGITISIPLIGGLGNADKYAPTVRFRSPTHMMCFKLSPVQAAESGNATAFSIELMPASELTQIYGWSPHSAASEHDQCLEIYANTDNPSERIDGGVYIIPNPQVDLHPTDKKRLANIHFDESNESIDHLTNFLSNESNAIVRAFNSTAGRGLAGTIDSLSFDYNDVPWEITPGQRAPMYTTVNMSFSPIHDISPGLDHMGFSRAPIHPLGLLAPQNQFNDDEE